MRKTKKRILKQIMKSIEDEQRPDEKLKAILLYNEFIKAEMQYVEYCNKSAISGKRAI